MRVVKRILLWIVIVAVVYVGGILLFGTLTDWAPTGEVEAEFWPGQSTEPLIQDSVVRLLTWNLGYGGIGSEDFFFYNRGDFFWTELGTVRMKKDRVEANVHGHTLITTNTKADIFLYQEVDTVARRSHDINMLDRLRQARTDYTIAFAPNFQSKRVPLPILQPWDHYGYVVGGLVSLSRFEPITSRRQQLPGEFSWPTKLFQLDRCALRQTYRTAGGKELVVYNIHLSAYDEDGGIRLQQTNFLREQALADYEAGNYVIIGGDWNQLPPGFNWFSLNPTVERVEELPTVAFDLMPPGWKYAYDPRVATVRASDQPYNSHLTRRSLIDFFLLSPNLRIKSVRGIDMEFHHSDHQPVYLEVELSH